MIKEGWDLKTWLSDSSASASLGMYLFYYLLRSHYRPCMGSSATIWANEIDQEAKALRGKVICLRSGDMSTEWALNLGLADCQVLC